MVNFFRSQAEKERARAFARLEGIVADWRQTCPAPPSETMIEALRSELRAAHDNGALGDGTTAKAIFEKYDDLAIRESEERLSVSGQTQELLALRRGERAHETGRIYETVRRSGCPLFIQKADFYKILSDIYSEAVLIAGYYALHYGVLVNLCVYYIRGETLMHIYRAFHGDKPENEWGDVNAEENAYILASLRKSLREYVWAYAELDRYAKGEIPRADRPPYQVGFGLDYAPDRERADALHPVYGLPPPLDIEQMLRSVAEGS